MFGKLHDGQFLVSGRITPLVLAALPRLEGSRRWLKTKELVCASTGHNREVLSQAGVIWADDFAAKVKEVETPTSYIPKTEPFEHQDRALKAMRGRKAFGLLMEQGTGKTKVIIDRAGELFAAGTITGVMVVSKKGVHRQWIDGEVPTHCGVPWEGAFWEHKPIPTSLMGRGETLKWTTFNYDALKTAGGFAEAEAFCKAHTGSLLIAADESQEIKDARSQRHEALSKLSKYSSHRAIATGTPIAKDLTDEWAQLKWLDEDIIGIRYKTAFQRRYCIMGGFQMRSVIGHDNVEEFKARTAPYIFRVTKDEIGIIPKQYNTWTFDITEVQKRHLAELKKDLETELASGELITAANAAVRIAKFQQIGNGFVFRDGEPIELMPRDKNPRLQAMLEWFRANSGKAIIWFRFRPDAAMIVDQLAANGISFVEYHGGVKDKDRSEAIRSFMDPLGAEVLVGNTDSAGTGHNLQGLCQRALYYSNSFKAINRWQSEDRIHRIGTVGTCVFTDLVGKGTPDAYILRNLKRKKSLSNLVLDDIREFLGEIG